MQSRKLEWPFYSIRHNRFGIYSANVTAIRNGHEHFCQDCGEAYVIQAHAKATTLMLSMLFVAITLAQRDSGFRICVTGENCQFLSGPGHKTPIYDIPPVGRWPD